VSAPPTHDAHDMRELLADARRLFLARLTLREGRAEDGQLLTDSQTTKASAYLARREAAWFSRAVDALEAQPAPVALPPLRMVFLCEGKLPVKRGQPGEAIASNSHVMLLVEHSEEEAADAYSQLLVARAININPPRGVRWMPKVSVRCVGQAGASAREGDILGQWGSAEDDW